MACCGKTICAGCRYEHELQSSGRHTCPFCRVDVPSSGIKIMEMLEERLNVNDVEVIYQLGCMHLNGDEVCGIEKDLDKAVELFHRAAELGSAEAYYILGAIYDKGEGVSKDETKAKQYHEKAAMAGDVNSRFILGVVELKDGGFDRAIKHWLIAASCGELRAVNNMNTLTAGGNATRDQYAQALRGYQQYLIEVRSDQRDRAAAHRDEYKYLFDT
jgi:TPR repeat protein